VTSTSRDRDTTGGEDPPQRLIEKKKMKRNCHPLIPVFKKVGECNATTLHEEEHWGRGLGLTDP